MGAVQKSFSSKFPRASNVTRQKLLKLSWLASELLDKK